MLPEIDTHEVIGGYKVHPVAAMFPLMEGDDYEKLKASIETHGQQQPIVLMKGALIDGRNRLRALLELGRQPVFEEYSGKIPINDFILAANLFRRHLTDDQRTMIVTQAKLWQEEAAAKDRRLSGKSMDGKAGGRANKKNLGANPTQGFREPKVSENIAAAAKTTDYQARQAIIVAKHAPDLTEPVKNGKLRLRDAAKMAKHRQRPKVAQKGFQFDDAIGDITSLAMKKYLACPERRRAEFKTKALMKLQQILGIEGGIS